MEIWKDAVGFEGLYQISNKGNFRKHENRVTQYTKKPLIRKQQTNRLGYKYVDLFKDQKKYKRTVHQLVAAAFIPNFKYGDIINHIDGNKANNCLENLEKVTASQNELHAHRIGLHKKSGKSKYHHVHIRHSHYKNSVYTFYVAQVKINGIRHYIMQSTDEVEAAKAVDAYLDSIHDTDHLRNFPSS